MAAQSSGSIQLAAVAIPVLALVITVAIDSIEEDDSAFYRGIIAGLSFLALATSMVVILLSALSEFIPVPSVKVVTNLIYASLIVGMMVFGVIFKESLRGLDNNEVRRPLIIMLVVVLSGFLILLFLPH